MIIMRLKIITFISLCFFSLFFTQKTKIEFLEKKDSLQKKERRDFIFIHTNTDLNTARYLSKIKGSGKTQSLNSVLMEVQRKSQKIGANAFKYITSKVENSNFEILLELYKIEEDVKSENKKFYPTNSIYVLGKDNLNEQTEEKYKLNKEEKTIKSGEYGIIPLNVGEKVSINKGGVMGMTYNYKGIEQMPSFFISFSGFGINGVAPNGIGLSFSAGKIYETNIDYGLLLSEIYKNHK